MMRKFGSFGAAFALPLVFLAVGVATAQEPTGPLQVRIREVSFDTNDQTRVIVSVSGPALPATPLGPDAFEVTEQGEPVEGLTVEPLFESQAQPVAVSLLVDISRSTRDLLDEAKEAARDFVDGLPSQVRANLFSFGDVVQEEVPFAGTLDATAREQLTSAINGLEPAQPVGTVLYDAILRAVDQQVRQSGAQANIVIFSDGANARSQATLQEAIAAIESANAATTTVFLDVTGRTDEAGLRALSDAVDGGSFLRVENTTALQAAFEGVAQAISSQYILTYTETATEPRDLILEVSVAAGGATVPDSVAVVNERALVQAAPPAAPESPLVPFLANRTGLYIGIGAVFIGILLFIGMLLYAPAGKRAERMLARGLRMYTRSGKEKDKKVRGEAGIMSGSALGRAAVGLAERMPRSKAFDERMQEQLDRAGWPLRSTEFVLIQVGALVVGALIGFVLLGSVVTGIILTVIGALAPRLALTSTMQRREAAFLTQLPDTLQLLAGSLQAGYGFMQAIDTVAKESPPPTSSEFQRVLAESRLGMPVEDALDSMAERLANEDFKWVVLAINIQRQVGGNLATLLQTVADTLREREQVRRQIKVLSAEGRLSAVILTALPFVLVGYLSVVNPEYLGSLTEVTIGKIAIVVALVLMGIGVVWMRKIIKIDV